MNNEYAIEVLEEQIKERKKYIDNWETKDTKLIRANISLLQSAIKQLSSTDKVIAEGEICVKDSDEVLFGFVGKDLQSDFDDCILENGLCGHKAKLILREVK